MKIPPQAKRVFQGVIFDVYQWEQPGFDKKLLRFEMLKRANTLQIIATDGEQILLGNEEQPTKSRFISLLGGRQEENETPLEGAKRELLEESGYASDDWELFLLCEPYSKMEWTVYTYIARNCHKIQEQKLDSGEKITIRKVNFDEFCDLVLSNKFYGRELASELIRMKCLEPERLLEFRKKLGIS